MAKLRRNHSKHQRSGAITLRVIGFLIAVGLMMFFLYSKLNNGDFEQTGETDPNSEIARDDWLPISTTGDVVYHKHYTLSYDENHEQAEWVAYKLTESSLKVPNVKRAKRFHADPMVPTRSAHHRDYTHSGYTRGHLAPAGDMAFDIEAMQESFYMSNMSPQLREFNGGIWKELEETVRDWAYHNEELLIVTGPILSEEHIIKTIGKSSKVSVPDMFYKVIVDNYGNSKKGIGFLIPNSLSKEPLSNYAVSIDSIETITGLDFFSGAFEDKVEKNIESKINLRDWKFSKKRFTLRVERWNNN